MKAKSKNKFSVSGGRIPNKTAKGKATVIASALNVRCWTDKHSDLTKFSPLMKGDVVTLCDAKLSDDGKPWYYIRYGEHYGFVNGAYLKELNSHREKFLAKLKTYSDYIKEHPKNFHREYESEMVSFTKAKNRVKAGKKVGITCVVPIRWALYSMKITREYGKALIVGQDGTFRASYSGKVKKYLTRLTGINKKAKDVALKPGDIIAWKGKTHTCVWSGNKLLMYDGGRSAEARGYKTGILLDYTEVYKNEKISEILRWKD